MINLSTYQEIARDWHLGTNTVMYRLGQNGFVWPEELETLLKEIKEKDYPDTKALKQAVENEIKLQDSMKFSYEYNRKRVLEEIANMYYYDLFWLYIKAKISNRNVLELSCTNVSCRDKIIAMACYDPLQIKKLLKEWRDDV